MHRFSNEKSFCAIKFLIGGYLIFYARMIRDKWHLSFHYNIFWSKVNQIYWVRTLRPKGRTRLKFYKPCAWNGVTEVGEKNIRKLSFNDNMFESLKTRCKLSPIVLKAIDYDDSSRHWLIKWPKIDFGVITFDFYSEEGLIWFAMLASNERLEVSIGTSGQKTRIKFENQNLVSLAATW